jgi:hypothetical protein
MESVKEQRKEQRLHYDWPIRFAKDFDEPLCMGEMVDVSSYYAAFTCKADTNCPYTGQEIRALFNVPRFGRSSNYDMASYNRLGRIYRVDEVNEHIKKVVIQFAKPLYFKPGEQGVSESEAKHRLLGH